jgi:hypothetical protein
MNPAGGCSKLHVAAGRLAYRCQSHHRIINADFLHVHSMPWPWTGLLVCLIAVQVVYIVVVANSMCLHLCISHFVGVSICAPVQVCMYILTGRQAASGSVCAYTCTGLAFIRSFVHMLQMITTTKAAGRLGYVSRSIFFCWHCASPLLPGWLHCLPSMAPCSNGPCSCPPEFDCKFSRSENVQLGAHCWVGSGWWTLQGLGDPHPQNELRNSTCCSTLSVCLHMDLSACWCCVRPCNVSFGVQVMPRLHPAGS